MWYYLLIRLWYCLHIAGKLLGRLGEIVTVNSLSGERYAAAFGINAEGVIAKEAKSLCAFR